MERTDSELVAAINSGDQGALALLYDRYADRLYGFCYSMLRNREEAADAVHDTILKASQKLDQLRDPSRLRSWLFAIARNEVISQTRRRSHQDDREVPEMAADLPEMEQGIARTEIQSLVWEAAAGLQPRDRELLELHLREGLDGEDLAAVLGVKTSHVHVLMSRMRDRMEKSMGSLLVARLGRDECEELNNLLAEWDGAFSLDVRSKVTRHIEKCDVCKKKRAAVLAPSALASAMPLVVAPAALRERTLSSVFSGGGSEVPQPMDGVTEEGWAWRDDGFPEPFSHSAAGKAVKAAWWAVAAGMILFVGAVVGAIALLGGGTDGEELTLVVPQPTPTATEVPVPTSAASEAPTAPAITDPTAEPSPTAEPDATETPAATPAPIPSPTAVATPTAVPTATTTPTPTPRPPGLGVTSDVLDFGAVDTQRQATITNSGDLPLKWSATVSGAGYSLESASGEVQGGGTGQVTVRVDRSGLGEGDIPGGLTINGPSGQSLTVALQSSVETSPVFTLVIMSQSTIQANGPTCGPNQVDVQAEVTDAAGVSSVVASFAPNGGATSQLTLSPSGGPLWVGTITGIQNGAVPSLAVTVVATDTRGNQATGSTSIIVITCT